MQTNPNQQIHTDYQIDDVFKPEAANQLARSIHYDFVITQKMFDAYVEKHPSFTYIDVGLLICSKPDGTDGYESGTVLAKAPVNIYIDADTGRMPIEFTYELLNIIDCSDFKVGGSWDAFVTKDMMNIYSSHPYIVQNLAGGFNFWSSPTAYVETAGYNTNAGIAKIGSYKLTHTTNICRPDNFQLVIEGLGLGLMFTYTGSDASPDEHFGGLRPSIVYGNWMTGSGLSTQYSIHGKDTVNPTTIKNGLYAQMQASVADWDTEPILVVTHNYSTSRYQLSGWDSFEFRFVNASEGKTVTIYKDGTVKWGYASAVSGGGGSSAIISDFLVHAIADDSFNPGLIHPYIVDNGFGSASSFNEAQLLVVLPNENRFLTPKQDMGTRHSSGEPASPNWYSGYPGFSFQHGAITKLDWYFWYAILDYNDFTPGATSTTNIWIKNPRLTLYIAIDELKEGVVYEVNLHSVWLPMADPTTIGNPAVTYRDQASPVTNKVSGGGTLDYNSFGKPAIRFVGYNSVPTYVKYWGSECGSDNVIYPAFYATPSPNYGAPGTQSNNYTQLRDMATARVLFTYLNGKVFVMSY